MEFTYRFKPDRWSSHGRMLSLVRPNSTVLDVGCAQGYIANVLKNRGCSVTGIEPDPQAARSARKYCKKIYVADAEEVKIASNEKFDYILCGDVLEHMKNPEKFLQRMRNHLTPSGKIIASIPNVAHFSVRISLLIGMFNYSERGIMDKTHLKFYTKKTMKKLFTENGYRVGKMLPTPIPFPTLSSWFASGRILWPIHVLSYFATWCWRTLFAFQFVIVAQTTR